MAKISERKIKILRCPDPIHKGREVPASEFGKGGNNGRQGYCKSCRARKAREKYQEKKKANKKKTTKRKTVLIGKASPLFERAFKIATTERSSVNPDHKFLTHQRCKNCKESKPKTSEYWQSNGRGGYRQPCKECLKNIGKSKKES